MHNEKLFDKIREAAWNDTSEPDEWDADKVWASVQSRQMKSKKRWLWLPYAVAASVVLTALLIGFNVMQPAEKPISNVQASPPVKADWGEKSVSQLKQKPVIKKTIGSIRKSKSQLAPVTGLAPVPQSESTPAVQVQHFPSADSNRIVHFQDKQPLADSSDINVEPAAVIGEKVLVVEIALPENKGPEEELTSLQVMFIQAKKEREARKLRVKYQKAKVPGLWSFVHHSFLETP